MNTKYRKSPAAYSGWISFAGDVLISPFRLVLLGCLLLLVLIAAPVQGQGPTATPASSPNPSPGPCGLPAAYSVFSSPTTFSLTSDCALSGFVGAGQPYLRFEGGGSYTINGNGRTISGAATGYLIQVTGTGTTLTLNNVRIRQAGLATHYLIRFEDDTRMNGRNIIFEQNTNRAVLRVDGNVQVRLENVQFLSNTNSRNNNNDAHLAVVTDAGETTSTVTLTNTIFKRNTGSHNLIISDRSTVTLAGCFTAPTTGDDRNTRGGGTVAAAVSRVVNSGTVTNNSGGAACPDAGFPFDSVRKRAKKTPPPTPTATQRPRPVTCPALSQATGIVIHAVHGLASGVQCQQLDGGGIGIQALADNYIAAVDIWGWVDQGVEVCFPRAGRIIFLDAAMIPRSMALMQTYIVGDRTCAAIDTAGSLVLLPPE